MLPTLDRNAVRQRFEERFSALAMASRYLEIYAKLPQVSPLTEAA